MHHLPALLTHPSRRIRLLAVGLHTTLLTLPPANAAFLALLPDADNLEALLGTWCAAAHDVDRQVAMFARRSWTTFVASCRHFGDAEAEWDTGGTKLRRSDGMTAVIAWTSRVALDPGSAYAYLNPAAVAPEQPAHPTYQPKGGRVQRVQPPPKKSGVAEREDAGRGKGGEEEEDVKDRDARMRIAALGALAWLVGECVQACRYLWLTLHQETLAKDPLPVRTPEAEEPTKEITSAPLAPLHALLDNPLLWTSLYYGRRAPFGPQDMDIDAFGHEQPGVRRVAWSVVLALLRHARSAPYHS